MAFSFGGDRSSSRTRSQSSSFDNLDSGGFNFGTGASRGQSRQRIAFEDVFRNLFGGASAAASEVDTAGLGEQAGLLFSSGGRFLDTLQGGGAGRGFLEERLERGDRLANEQIDLLGEDISRFLAEDVTPAITSGGVAAGTLGGSRGEVQRGLAADAALREFRRGASDIRLREQGALDQLATTLAADEQQGAVAGLSAAPSLFGLAQDQALSGLSPLLALSSILGGPTVLTESEQSAEDLSLGRNFSRGRAGSQSTSRTDSDSVGFNFGF